MIPAVTTGELLNTHVLHNSLGDWVIVFVLLLGGFIAGKVVSFLLDKQADLLARRSGLAGLAAILRAASRPASPVVLGLALLACQSFLTLDVDKAGELIPRGPIRVLWIKIAQAIIAAAVSWFLFRLVDLLEHLLGRLTGRTHSKLDDQLVPLLRKTLRVFIVILAALFIGQAIFEWEIGAIVAGLGIGGLAFALAAQDSLANLFGSVVIFADQPFAVGDRIKVSGSDGIVQEVGFRSTKMRTLEGHLVTIPNSVVSNQVVENIGKRPYIRRILNVGLTYDTPPQRMARAVEIAREMLAARGAHFPADLPGRAYFTDYNSDNLNIMIIYWFSPPEWWDFLAFNHEFNMELLQRFNDEGLEFAFPTQTLYLKRGDQDAPPATPAPQGGAAG